MSEARARWPERARYLAKRAFAEALYHTGFLALWIRASLRGRAVVLMYHRVLSDAAAARTWSHPAIIVRRPTFERHLQLLRRHLDVISAAAFERRIHDGVPFESPSCLISFDDGWIDTYTEAWPALRRHGCPAIVFLPTRFIGSSDRFWQEALSGLLFDVWRMARRDAAFAARARVALTHGLHTILDVAAADIRGAIADAVQELKRTASAHAPAVIEHLERLLPRRAQPAEVDGFLTWEQAREMAADGITFGAHGVTHRLLTTLPVSEVEAEVRDSRAAIEHQLGRDVTAFSYPNGSFDAAIAEVVRAAGFRAAFSTARGAVRAGSDPFTVRRINIHEDMTGGDAMFLARVAGLL